MFFYEMKCLNDSMNDSDDMSSCNSSMFSVTRNTNVQLKENLVSHFEKDIDLKCNLYGGHYG